MAPARAPPRPGRACSPCGATALEDLDSAHVFAPMNAASWFETLPAERWRSLLLSDGPKIATWVLSIAIAVQAGFIVTDLFSGGSTKAQARAASRHAPPLNASTISQAHLFGAPPRPSGENAPETRMPLVLTGIMAGNHPQAGLAILGPNPQSTKVYAVGDNLPGGARLHLVYADRIVIDRNGELESLTLPRKSANNAPPPTTAALGGGNPAIEHMRQMISTQPGIIGDVMRPQPVMEHGKLSGFRVYPGRNRQAFMSLGLRAGDVVTAINGTPLDDKDRSDEIMRTISSASEVQVTVMRGGQPQDLTLNLAQVAAQMDGLASASSQPAAGETPGAAPAPGGATPDPPAPGAPGAPGAQVTTPPTVTGVATPGTPATPAGSDN
jgi:general secretion pathway protein C